MEYLVIVLTVFGAVLAGMVIGSSIRKKRTAALQEKQKKVSS